MDDDDVLDLTQRVLPWVSTQALRIGNQTLDNTYGKLGCDLFILAEQIPSIIEDKTVRTTLVKVLRLLNKACSVGTTRKMDNDQLSTLRKIQLYTPETLDERIRSSLTHFVRRDPEFHVLQRLVQDCLKANESIASPSDEKEEIETDEMEYPAYINDVLYEQLRLHACCNCNTGHLEWTQLRLGTENQRINADVEFELLFNPNPQSPLLLEIHGNNHIRWKEAIVLVSTSRGGGRKVAFRQQTPVSLQPLSNGIQIPSKARHISLGEFCNLINSHIHNRVYFHMQGNAMKVIDNRDKDEVESHRILPDSGISLGDWLLKTPHLSNRGKVTLAYILVRSAWRYYDSLWMMTPWTHETICLLNEKSLTAERGRPHPYLRRQLIKVMDKKKEVYIAKDLMYRFPHILSLGILLIEIAIKQPLKEGQSGRFLSEKTINDYYAWAWTTANRSNLKQSIHTIYEEVVDNCLNPDLFETSLSQESSHEESTKILKRLLYEKIVSPLKRLYDAYQENWEVSVPVTLSTKATNYIQSTKNSVTTSSLSPDQFTVAILCALPLEIDAVSSLFDEIWDESIELLRNAPNDSNAYTIGRMGGRMVVLVHMPGMGKSAASQSASSLQSTFPNIKLALVVGICAGAPHYGGESDIILGDVVISEGIIQYDFGRLLPGTFRRKESMHEILGRPNTAIRTLISKMKTRKKKEGLMGKIIKYLQIIDDNLGDGSAQYPGTSQDELFQPNYAHKHYKPGACSTCNIFEDSRDLVCDNASDFTCEQLGCQKDNLIARDRLKLAAGMGKPPTPKVHIGLVGSGDTVMKSGIDRDRIASRDKVIAFEMEGAGVWDVLPCIVVKGVCDYADSHKNKVWQGYAAATGAACMRAVLDLWTH